MENSNPQRIITFSKLHTRGDEVGTLFFAVTILCFLIISLIRFSVVGKMLDDLCFTFLFGWIKYLVYGISFFAIIPLCFGYHLKMKPSNVGKLVLILVLVCWTTQTLSLIINNRNHLYSNYHNLNLISITTNYANTWWSSSIFTNYNGFFGKPISFPNLGINTFFPRNATGGMISTILTGLFSYGFFATNVFSNIIGILLLVSLLFFKRPLIIFSKFKLCAIAFTRMFKSVKTKSKTKRTTKKQFEAKKLIHEQNHKQILADKVAIEKEVLKEIKGIRKQTKNTSQLNDAIANPISNLEKTIKLKQQQILSQQKQQTNDKELDTQETTSAPEIINNKSQHYFNEDSHLTPFGKINPDSQKDNVNVNKGVLVIKKSLEDSVFNNQSVVPSSENNIDSDK
ncbi:hypothetical protein [Spiroplasma sp. AdecLV25b]|uniref:hypothetical protein n=1 Tax=Spiroplasma sp. AdecLV25b TaxID=3027162 RepID=UPI0027DF4C1E|nr:hypothetical protein [Spiroplasma sp. AdecLV25b]